MAPPPLVALLLSPERLRELEWMWLDTPALLTVLSTCRALRTEHQWRADAICQDVLARILALAAARKAVVAAQNELEAAQDEVARILAGPGRSPSPERDW